MEPTRIDPEAVEWESWPESPFIDETKLRWKLLFSAPKTPTAEMSMGLAEIAPGGELPRHRHAPGEIYHGVSGEGEVEIEGRTYTLSPGRSLFIPSNVWHRTAAMGSEPLRFLFLFPTSALDDVHYDFGEG
ncbi:MAG TPA: cupin domain-containing protein [Mesorhizobium sp.]|jgi:quercetin dioxygenase-like cupin family protein|nr:cupin domain-containing protein [Mesorhizobium sp.]